MKDRDFPIDKSDVHYNAETQEVTLPRERYDSLIDYARDLVEQLSAADDERNIAEYRERQAKASESVLQQMLVDVADVAAKSVSQWLESHSIRQLSERTGIPYATCYRIVNERLSGSQVDLDTLGRLARAIHETESEVRSHSPALARFTTVRAVPEGYHTVTPHLTVRNAARAIEFYEKAFGAVEKGVMKGPGGKIMHAELRIGDSIVMLADEFPEFRSLSHTLDEVGQSFAVTRIRQIEAKALRKLRHPLQTSGGASVGLHIYVENVDAMFERALKAGARLEMPVADMFWGDRYGKLSDPFGYEWAVATHVRNVSADEMRRALEEAVRPMSR